MKNRYIYWSAVLGMVYSECYADMVAVPTTFTAYSAGPMDLLLLIAVAAGYLLYKRNKKPDA